ncbi:MAG: sigma-70 family RNA polymerase sigma factor [Ilumatobacteraceae bacterium]
MTPADVPSGWADVYEVHAQRLTHLAVLLAGPADAHDLVTDAVWKAVGSPRWRDVDSQGAYLTRVVVNLAHDRRRQADRRTRRERRAVPPATGADTTADTDRALVVRTALHSLSAAQLSVVYLHYWEDLTLDGVAAQLGIGVGTARSHLDRAKRRLRTVLPHFEGELR